ncbi:lipocalin family protein [Nemorincola caseinilytica]|uniref:Lipocalin family protein n=1 Tax=Nemorincola caseinilytica TaxID=2054315 RepID=A0ABP8NRH6_9BACT
MIRYAAIVWAFLLASMAFVCDAQPLRTVPSVDVNKYAGKWYEIASFPQRFQKGCHCTTAEYELCDRGYVIVHNRCRKDGPNGKVKEAWGKAFIQKNSGNAKLKVRFRWPFSGKYWIIDLADNYSYAVVSHPNKKYLWILSRSPQMSTDTYQAILARLEKKGFDLEKLRRTDQVCK